MDPLHQIIQTLNKAEKRYFRLFSTSFKSDSDILMLYDVLEDMKEYDEEAVKSKTGIKNLAAAKWQLRKLLLKAMRNYREDDNPADRIRCALSEIEFLTNKGLKGEARKEINKLMKTVRDAELYYGVAELAVRLALNTDLEKDKEKFFSFFEQAHADVDSASRGMKEMYDALLFQSMAVRYSNQYDYEKPHLRQSTIDGFQAQAIEKAEKVSSVRARLLYYGVLCDSFNTRKQYDKALEYHEKSLQLFEQHPFLYEVPKTFFFTVISNYIVTAIAADDIPLTEKLCNRLQKWVDGEKDYFTVNPEVFDRVRIRLLSTRISICHMQENADSILRLEPDLESFFENPLATNAQRTSTPLMTLRMIATLVSGNKNDRARYWIEKFYTLDAAKLVKLIYYNVRFLEVILFYNEGDLNIADTKAINFYKLLADSELEEPFFKDLGKFLRKLCKWNFKEEKDRKECDEVLKAMEERATEGGSANLFAGVFDLRKWFNEKQKIRSS